MNLTEPPEGIIITISQSMLKEKGYRNWLRNFKQAMESEQMTYWMRQVAKPKRDILYVYLCIGGKVRFRAFYAGTDSGHMIFSDGKEMFAKTWIIMCGPLSKPDYIVPMKGFRGFRYTEKLF